MYRRRMLLLTALHCTRPLITCCLDVRTVSLCWRAKQLNFDGSWDFKSEEGMIVQLWTMTKNFDTNHTNIRYWPWASSFKVTKQNYFSVYFSIFLPIRTHCQPLKWSQVCIQWSLCKKNSGLLKRDFVGKCACLWEFIVKANIMSPVMAETERTRRIFSRLFIYPPPPPELCDEEIEIFKSWNVNKIRL